MMILQTQGQPLDLGLTLKAGQAFRWQRDGDGWWVGVISGQLVRIRQHNDGGDLEFECAPGPEGSVGELLHRYFRLDDPIAEIYQSISRNDAMAKLVDRYRGLRLLRQDPWECLVSYICSATNSVGRISESMENCRNDGVGKCVLAIVCGILSRRRWTWPRPMRANLTGKSKGSRTSALELKRLRKKFAMGTWILRHCRKIFPVKMWLGN